MRLRFQRYDRCPLPLDRRRLAEDMQASIREVDRVARFGGDEFCVVLPGSDTDDGLVVAHKL